jgi:Holliday junction DNA helicase RuvA
MIRQLHGMITHIEDNALVLSVHGIGYLVYTPTATNEYTLNEDVVLYTYLAVRETALDLYGFTTDTERRLFELLLKVPKIGPKSALAVMTQASPTLLIEQIANNEPAQLHKLSGIGKKTCENIVTQLHDKLGDLAATVTDSRPVDPTQADAIDALIALGYDAAAARETVQTHTAPGDSVNQIIKKALKQLP